jgi:phosphatidylglycerol:prolipoprotein diacylglycerol transferase
MLPFFIEIFGYKVYGYGITMVIAFIICITITLKYVPKDLLSSQDIYNFCLIIMASLLFGTKLLGLFAYGNFDLSAFLDLLKFWERGNFSFFPAFLLAIILIFVYCKVKEIPLLKTMDYLLPIAILGVGIQRTFGCFLAGCCYGKPTNLPWGMVFPAASRAGQHFPGIPLHPTQLYYGITAFMIFVFLLLYNKRTQKTGEITGLGFMMLASSYFFITFLRGDIQGDQVFFHLSRSQYLALGLFVVGLLIEVFVKSGDGRQAVPTYQDHYQEE